MKYMMLIAGSEEAWAGQSEEELAALYGRIGEWWDEQSAAGRIIEGHELQPLDERLDGYHLFHAARAELLRRLGRTEDGRDADRRALALTDNPAERRLLEERIG
ncbi:MAG: hypothetical protein ABIP01_03525 [Candidatus Limnocylindria bacterium]